MPTLELKKGEIHVPRSLVIRMTDRMHKLGNATRCENYVARARKRLDARHPGKNDAAVELAAGGSPAGFFLARLTARRRSLRRVDEPDMLSPAADAG